MRVGVYTYTLKPIDWGVIGS